jgi:hypothetical protein
MRLSARVAPVVAMIFFALPAAAQTSFSIAAGAALPTGGAAEDYNLGYNATVGIGIKPPLAPLGFRLEGMINAFDGKRATDGKLGILAGTANITLSGSGMPIPMGYLIGGLGMYNVKVTDLPLAAPDQSSSDLGFNIGAGINFPLTGFSTYLEARFHYISDSKTKFVPIVFGLKF